MGTSRPAPAPATTTTVQTAEPPAFIRPFLEEAAEAAVQEFRGAPQQFFPGETVVPLAPESEEALRLTAQRARAGSPLVTSAQQTALETVQGRGVNPFLAPAAAAATAPLFERFQEETLPGLRSAFAGIGRSGSGAEERALQRATRELGRGVSEQAARLALAGSESEAQRQLAATQLAPGLAEQDFTGFQRLAQVGATRESQEAARLQEEIDRFNFAQNARQQQINQLIGQLGALGGGGVTTTQQIQQAARSPSSPLIGGLGGAATGAGLGSLFGPAGTAVGLGTGALLGLFGGI